MSINLVLKAQVASTEYRRFVASTTTRLGASCTTGLPTERIKIGMQGLSLAIATKLALIGKTRQEGINYFRNNYAAPLAVFGSCLRESNLMDVEEFVSNIQSFWLMRLSANVVAPEFIGGVDSITEFFLDTESNLNGTLRAALSDPKTCQLITQAAGSMAISFENDFGG